MLGLAEARFTILQCKVSFQPEQSTHSLLWALSEGLEQTQGGAGHKKLIDRPFCMSLSNNHNHIADSLAFHTQTCYDAHMVINFPPWPNQHDSFDKFLCSSARPF